MGKSGCGKSTLERGLVNTFPLSFRKVVSCTTRDRREGEEHGVDYYFYPDSVFDEVDLVQYTEFAGHRYGSAVNEYTTEHRYPILCVVPESAAQFTQTIQKRFPDFQTCNVYFNISDERLIQNMKNRGDTDEMIEKRIAQDDLDQQFRDSGLTLDIEIGDNDLNGILPYKVFCLIKRFERSAEL